MNFGLTSEQHQLAGLAREILSAECPAPARDPLKRSGLEAALTETGLAGVLVPEALGGGGATLVEAAILGEAFGYAGAPGAVIASTLVSAAALDLVRGSNREVVAQTIVNGGPCAVLVRNDLAWPPSGAGAVAWGWRDGAIVLAPEGDELVHDSDAFVDATTADLALSVGRRNSERTDARASEPAAVLSTIACSIGGRRFHAAANVIMSSVLLGHMAAAFDAAVEYSKQRMQYGAHIGSFQAIRHLCADMLVDFDASRSATYGAAWAVGARADVDECERAGAVAKAWCSEAGLRVCEASLQVHGGIGFTWESTIHDHLRSTLVARASFMTHEHALDLVAEARSWI